MSLHSLVELMGSQDIGVTVDGIVAVTVAASVIMLEPSVLEFGSAFVVGKSSGEVLWLMLVLVVGVVGDNSGVLVVDGTRFGLM